MNDILPDQTPSWQYLERVFRKVVRQYGYREIRFPVIEQTQLFKRSIGEVTDIVEKEMYSFDDRNGDNLSLRPEGTAGCVRAADQHGLLYNQQQRLWYHGPMFRHERPQKGRYRQFHQFGVEAFGMAGPDIDAELISLSHQLWQELGLSQHVKLLVNNIGSAEDRKRYSQALTAFLARHEDKLDDDARRRLHSNPMRILDSKNPALQEVIADAPLLADYVSETSTQHYDQLQQLLASAGVEFEENPRLVRGLDYYNNCVFEWTTESLGAQGAVCGGGRYDGLVEQLGGKATLAAGFAIGEERIVLMLDSLGLVPKQVQRAVDVYLLADSGQSALTQGLAGELRQALPQLSVLAHCGGGKTASQLKKAIGLGARLAIYVEEGGASLRLRVLDEGNEQRAVEPADLANAVLQLLEE
jgi:histidyl-tRNA synthetase